MTWINVFWTDWNIASSLPLQILQGTIHNRCWVWKGTEGDFHLKPMKVDFLSVKCIENGYHGFPREGTSRCPFVRTKKKSCPGVPLSRDNGKSKLCTVPSRWKPYHGGPKIGKISQCCTWMVPKKRKSISQCLYGAKCSQNSISKHSKNTIGWNHFWKAIFILFHLVFL